MISLPIIFKEHPSPSGGNAQHVCFTQMLPSRGSWGVQGGGAPQANGPLQSVDSLISVSKMLVSIFHIFWREFCMFGLIFGFLVLFCVGCIIFQPKTCPGCEFGSSCLFREHLYLRANKKPFVFPLCQEGIFISQIDFDAIKQKGSAKKKHAVR